MKNNPQFLVRPDDMHIFELDESNNCYRSYSCKSVTYPDGTRPDAQSHFTFENLTQNYRFFAIDPSELESYEKSHEEYYEYLSWSARSDGHGGSKGGTIKEFLEMKNKQNGKKIS